MRFIKAEKEHQAQLEEDLEEHQQLVNDSVGYGADEADFDPEQHYSDYDEAAAKKAYEDILYNEKLQRSQQQQRLQEMRAIEQEHMEKQLALQREQEQLQKRQQEIIDQVLKADQSRPTSGLYSSDRAETSIADLLAEANQSQVQTQAAISSASQHSATPSHKEEKSDKPEVTSRQALLEKNGYTMCTLKLVGHLRGSAIIRDSSKIHEIDLADLEKYYENGNEGNDEEKAADDESTQFMDPYSADLFKDEIIELDYGAIDAYTSALNAHLVAERNNEPVPTDLRFASHILTSNHAMFLENQMFLGDAYFSTGISREVSLISKEPNNANAANTSNTNNGCVFLHQNMHRIEIGVSKKKMKIN